ncbi:Transcriptional regulator [Collimonas arenae]|uniref:Transcriptional regulator n=1 Tax=Collimonas arenae TaxID=279058 RepID=A0A0A1F849_9BURK|nr:GntR family transcriptional regulator [Collimonas arenae]AIY39965.1 Transcriptional regulator [Collimonas arenae]
MNFDILPRAPTPIYRQIVEQVRRLIASGALRPGDDLPSVRAVALQHAINPMTVSKAYSLLEAEGVLTRRRGVGMMVADTDPPVQDKLALLRPALLSATQIVRQLNISEADAHAVFQTCLNEWSKNEPDD